MLSHCKQNDLETIGKKSETNDHYPSHEEIRILKIGRKPL